MGQTAQKLTQSKMVLLSTVGDSVVGEGLLYLDREQCFLAHPYKVTIHISFCNFLFSAVLHKQFSQCIYLLTVNQNNSMHFPYDYQNFKNHIFFTFLTLL